MQTYRFLFFPFALIYGLVVRFRHLLFDMGILQSKSFKIPTIGVGNLAMGGTGKTPHVEMLIRLLMEDNKVAVLSRGYGRKTRGYIKADQYSKYRDIGDEPMQYYRKFKKNVTIAVESNRRKGIKNLMEDKAGSDVIILDDSFQHRYVKTGITILLTDFHKLYKSDYLFPVGKLRDIASAAKRADIIIVTKTNKVLSPITRRNIEEKLNPEPNQKLFFSYIKYGNFIPLEGVNKGSFPREINTILLFSGIANPYPLQEHLRFRCSELVIMDFPDHHNYSQSDLIKIREKFDTFFTRKKIIVTTEKDAMRLINSPYISELKNLPVFFLPMSVALHKEDRQSFNDQIVNYVRENKLDR
ncbi:MAG: tetraacyldisaccharide 4'-kinase [Marinilabiliales bacterium]|nr:MAG: tetraacyldisaccharide 4'-kinase [Marinilabiliales bacterium]